MSESQKLLAKANKALNRGRILIIVFFSVSLSVLVFSVVAEEGHKSIDFSWSGMHNFEHSIIMMIVSVGLYAFFTKMIKSNIKFFQEYDSKQEDGKNL